MEWVHTQPEILLLATAILLYLHDLGMLLFANEVLLLRSGGGAWTARTARRHPEFARRYLALVRPWRPDTLVVRSCWPRTVPHEGGPQHRLSKSISEVERKLRFLRLQMPPLLLTMFAGLPFLYGFLGPRAFLLGVAAVYGQITLSLACLLLHRKRLNLPLTSVAFIALESLLCIPHAINLYRKVADRLLPRDEEPIALAGALLDGEGAASFRRDLLEALDVHIGLPGGDDSRQERLVRYRQRVLEWGAA